MQELNGIQWFTGDEMAKNDGVSRPTIERRYQTGKHYAKEVIDGVNHYAYAEPEQPEEQESEESVLPPEASPEVKAAYDALLLDKINAERARVNKEIYDTEQIQLIVASVEKREDAIKLDMATAASDREEALKTKADAALLMQSVNKLKAEIEEQRKANEAESKRLAVLIPKVEQEAEETNAKKFEDFLYDKFTSAGKLHIVVPVGYPTYNGKFKLSYEQALKIRDNMVKDWSSQSYYKNAVQINA